jgi:hypothetical protein
MDKQKSDLRCMRVSLPNRRDGVRFKILNYLVNFVFCHFSKHNLWEMGVAVKESVLQIIVYYLAREKKRGRIGTIPILDSCSCCVRYSVTDTCVSYVIHLART